MKHQLMTISTGTPVMTSLELVELINAHRKEVAEAAGAVFPSRGHAKLDHSDLLKKVPDVLGACAGKFSATYQVASPNGGSRSAPCYAFPKREACLMAMSYSYELQARVYDRMTELEAKAAHPAPALPDFSNPAIAARAWADQYEQRQAAEKQLALAAPKVEFVDRYVESTGLKGFRQVAKLLQANESRFREFLKDKHIMYKLGGEWVAHQQHIDAGRFQVKAGTSEVSGHAFNSCRFTPRGVSWIAGLWAQHQLEVSA